MERTAAVLHAEVVMGAAIAKRARGAAVNFMVDGFTKSEEAWRKKAFIVRAIEASTTPTSQSHAEPREPSKTSVRGWNERGERERRRP